MTFRAIFLLDYRKLHFARKKLKTIENDISREKNKDYGKLHFTRKKNFKTIYTKLKKPRKEIIEKLVKN